MPNKPKIPFLLFCLPLLVLKKIFTLSTTYELFAYSILSKRAKRIVQLACSHRKFELNISPRTHHDMHYLCFSDMYCDMTPDSRLNLYVNSTDAQIPKGLMNLNGNLIPACIKFKKVGLKNVYFDDSISTNWEDQNYGLRWLFQHLSDTFKIGYLALIHCGIERSVLIETATFLKTIRLINKLHSAWNIYTFEEVIRFMPTNCLSIQYPKMKYTQLIALFNMWKKGEAAEKIIFYECPKHMSIRPLARLLGGTLEVSQYGCRSFEVKRNDGRRGKVTVCNGHTIKFSIDRS